MTDKMRETFELSGAGGTRKHPVSWDDPAVEVERQIWIAATLAERERCALVCESLHYTDISTAQNCADAIRQGGDA